jgi:hypothetical protein
MTDDVGFFEQGCRRRWLPGLTRDKISQKPFVPLFDIGCQLRPAAAQTETCALAANKLLFFETVEHRFDRTDPGHPADCLGTHEPSSNGGKQTQHSVLGSGGGICVLLHPTQVSRYFGETPATALRHCRCLQKAEGMSVYRNTKALSRRTFLVCNLTSELTFEQLQGLRHRQSRNRDRAHFSVQAALAGSHDKRALRKSVEDCLDRLAIEFDVVEQKQTMPLSQHLPQLGVTRLPLRITLIEGIDYELQQVAYRLFSDAAKINGSVREGLNAGMKGKVPKQ